tara:strand:- start:674 stop:892 length:219 start_codon:yes stop_codon:yes gene_type:complete
LNSYGPSTTRAEVEALRLPAAELLLTHGYDRAVTDVRHHCVAVGRTQRRRADRGPASRKLTNCDGPGISATI